MMEKQKMNKRPKETANTDRKAPMTARELVARRKLQEVSQAKTTAVALPDNREYAARYLDECDPGGTSGRLIKFDGKAGVFRTIDDDKEVSEKTTFLCLADETAVGWIKFAGEGEAPTRIMGLLFDDWQMPPREALGELDKSKWDLGLDNEPQDPWLHQQAIVLQDVESREIFTFTTTSKTGRRSVSRLLRHYRRLRKDHPGDIPLIRLQSGSFEHRDSRVGRVFVPVFVVVGRAPRDSGTAPDTSTAKFLDDTLPF
jgi:hypothetical protein